MDQLFGLPPGGLLSLVTGIACLAAIVVLFKQLQAMLRMLLHTASAERTALADVLGRLASHMEHLVQLQEETVTLLRQAPAGPGVASSRDAVHALGALAVEEPIEVEAAQLHLADSAAQALKRHQEQDALLDAAAAAGVGVLAAVAVAQAPAADGPGDADRDGSVALDSLDSLDSPDSLDSLDEHDAFVEEPSPLPASVPVPPHKKPALVAPWFSQTVHADELEPLADSGAEPVFESEADAEPDLVFEPVPFSSSRGAEDAAALSSIFAGDDAEDDIWEQAPASLGKSGGKLGGKLGGKSGGSSGEADPDDEGLALVFEESAPDAPDAPDATGELGEPDASTWALDESLENDLDAEAAISFDSDEAWEDPTLPPPSALELQFDDPRPAVTDSRGELDDGLLDFEAELPDLPEAPERFEEPDDTRMWDEPVEPLGPIGAELPDAALSFEVPEFEMSELERSPVPTAAQVDIMSELLSSDAATQEADAEADAVLPPSSPAELLSEPSPEPFPGASPANGLLRAEEEGDATETEIRFEADALPPVRGVGNAGMATLALEPDGDDGELVIDFETGDAPAMVAASGEDIAAALDDDDLIFEMPDAGEAATSATPAAAPAASSTGHAALTDEELVFMLDDEVSPVFSVDDAAPATTPAGGAVADADAIMFDGVFEVEAGEDILQFVDDLTAEDEALVLFEADAPSPAAAPAAPGRARRAAAQTHLEGDGLVGLDGSDALVSFEPTIMPDLERRASGLAYEEQLERDIAALEDIISFDDEDTPQATPRPRATGHANGHANGHAGHAGQADAALRAARTGNVIADE
ncbi:hypothetical protein [Megalodesulfovibrio gigas]|uniref:Uncharacterized protein n=1 Tax=Megalodesulfovibrio gigas (strain ATCC 19364 / DSM 1382 / NCIMB 9332 / VKM B-1759) TaxID=1121448 RepID=T2GFD9_MEGG1|nr:hypothetical protein [Megalodesulfovibrio gigas]AGW14899.1 hypothetical protein DGI_3190 [Megalodesulfovibrio gigas DSM 1382 = ATCC 19364]